MKIFPAIDLKDNKCVRLSKGEDNSSVIFNSNPIKQAKFFEDQGCSRLHLVDLDSAFGRNNINNKTIKVNLRGLYNRAKATNDLSITEKINKDSLIIVEGHYTSIKELDDVIDFNILLLAEKKELLERKINRVKHYRNSEDTKQYFNLIDVPSFVNHLSIFGCNYDLILDNTNYNIIFRPHPRDRNNNIIKKLIINFEENKRFNYDTS